MRRLAPAALPPSREGSATVRPSVAAEKPESPGAAAALDASTAQWKAVEAALALDHAVNLAKPLVARTEEALLRVDEAMKEYRQAVRLAEQAKAKGREVREPESSSATARSG